MGIKRVIVVCGRVVVRLCMALCALHSVDSKVEDPFASFNWHHLYIMQCNLHEKFAVIRRGIQFFHLSPCLSS